MHKKTSTLSTLFIVMMAIVISATIPGCTKKEDAGPAPLTVIPATINRGSQVFQQKCLVCHRIDGEGGKKGRDLSKAGKMYDRQYLRSVLDHGKYPPEMPSFTDLPREDREALIDFLMSLK